MFSNLKRIDLKRMAAVGVTVIAGAAAFSGCGLKIGEHPNQDVTVHLGSAETACLNGAAQTVADYFHGKTSDSQISGVFDCASNSLKLFQERTEGSRPGVYTPGELRKFLERYFLRDFTISDALMSEFMELKKTLLGGSTDELTVEELERLRNLLLTLRDVSVKLRPYLPLTPSHVSQLNDDEVETTIKGLRDAADSVGKILEEHASPYQFSHLDRLLGEIEKFLQDDDIVHDTAEFRKYLPLFISVKKIVVSPDTTQMANTDWRVLISRSADLYGNILRLFHLLDNSPTLISGDGRVHTLDVSERVYKLMREVVSSNPNGTISFCDIFGVIDEASRLYGYQNDLETLKKNSFKGYPSYLRVYLQDQTSLNDEDYLWYFKFGDLNIYRGTIKQSIIPVFQKWLKSAPTPSTSSSEPLLSDYLNACKKVNGVDYTTTGLKPENLDRFWDLITRLSDGQEFLEKSFQYAQDTYGGSSGNAVDVDTLPASLMAWMSADGLSNSVSFQHSLEYLYQVPSGTLSSDSVSSARFLSQLTLYHIPLFRQNDSQITFDDSSPALPGEIGRWRQSYVGLSALNGLWQGVHLIWDAYVADPDRIEGPTKDGTTGGVSTAELRQFYLDIRELGLAIKLFDPTVDSAPEDRFLEGNLFTYSSNGDDNLSLAETTDLLAFLLSTKQLSSKTYNLVHDQCAKWTDPCPKGAITSGPGCHIGGKDVFDMDTISKACFDHFAMSELYQPLWDHMPNLSHFYSTLPVLGNGTPVDGKVYRETFTCLLQGVARGKTADPNWIGSGDVDQISALEHYLEAMFVRFDANHSGTLNRDEALSAYRTVLKSVIGKEVTTQAPFLKTDDDFQAVLTYMLARGTLPSTTDWKSIIDFGIWRYIHESNFEADRARVVQVMAAITKADVAHCLKDPRVTPSKSR